MISIYRFAYQIGFMLFILSIQGLNAQADKTKELDNRHLVIKRYHVLTQEFIDLSNAQAKKDSLAMKDATWKDLEGNSVLNMPGPPLPPPAVYPGTKPYVKKLSFHFLVMPKHLIRFAVSNDFEPDSTVTSGISKISKISRDSLVLTEFNYAYFNQSSRKLITDFESSYDIQEIDKTDRKTILGFDCYKIVLHHNFTNQMMELYATEEIKLAYHPVFQEREYLKDFFPLYIRQYNEGSKNLKYTEYKFYEYR